MTTLSIIDCRYLTQNSACLPDLNNAIFRIQDFYLVNKHLAQANNHNKNITPPAGLQYEIITSFTDPDKEDLFQGIDLENALSFGDKKQFIPCMIFNFDRYDDLPLNVVSALIEAVIMNRNFEEMIILVNGFFIPALMWNDFVEMNMFSNTSFLYPGNDVLENDERSLWFYLIKVIISNKNFSFDLTKMGVSEDTAIYVSYSDTEASILNAVNKVCHSMNNIFTSLLHLYSDIHLPNLDTSLEGEMIISRIKKVTGHVISENLPKEMVNMLYDLRSKKFSKVFLIDQITKDHDLNIIKEYLEHQNFEVIVKKDWSGLCGA